MDHKKYLAQIGEKGGRSRSDRKVAAARKALERNRIKRWPQKGKPSSNDAGLHPDLGENFE